MIGEIPTRFRTRYAELYGVAPAGRVEFAALRVRLRRPVDRPPLVDQVASASEAPPMEQRLAWFGPEASVETDVVRRADFRPGVALSGPVIIEGAVETTVVPPGWNVRVDPAASLVIERAR